MAHLVGVKCTSRLPIKSSFGIFSSMKGIEGQKWDSNESCQGALLE